MNTVDYSMYILGNFDNGHLKPVRFLKQGPAYKKQGADPNKGSN